MSNISELPGANIASVLNASRNSQPEKEEPTTEQGSEPLELSVEQQDQTEKTDKASILEALKSVNQQIPLKSTNLVFEFDDANEPPIIKVVDKENGEVIREIPPKELREIAQALNEIADNLNGGSGILFNQES